MNYTNLNKIYHPSQFFPFRAVCYSSYNDNWGRVQGQLILPSEFSNVNEILDLDCPKISFFLRD